jgi:micrococcal nuclease
MKVRTAFFGLVNVTSVALLCVLANAWAAPAQAAKAQTQHGVVTWVSDGDSLWFTPPGKAPIQVRLRDIDAPEICQPGGTEAKEALEKLAFKQAATLLISGRDTYGRSLGTVRVGGVDVAQSLVEAGHAWSARVRWDQGPLVKQERMARALGRGLHGTPGAVTPATFRQSHGPCTGADKAPPG